MRPFTFCKALAAAALAILPVACGGGTAGLGNAVVPSANSLPSGSREHTAVAQFNGGSSFVEYDLPGTNNVAYGITSSRDQIWFSAGPVVGTVSVLTGAIAEYPVGLHGASGIAAGAAGEVWFTQPATSGTSQIGKISTSTHAVSEYALPAGATPYDIAYGADNAMWFADPAHNSIGRISETGIVTEYPLPHPGSHPARLTRGPDDNVWFIEDMPSKTIGRISPQGIVTEVGLLYATYGIARSGNFIYATQGAPSQNAYLQQISADGSQRPTISVNGLPIGIAVGLDGSIFVSQPYHYMDAVDVLGPTDTAFTQVALPSPESVPSQIVGGYDRNFWFTEGFSHKIGVYVRKVQTVSPGALYFTSVGQTQTLAVTETSNGGPYYAKSSNPKIVTVSSPSATGNFTATATGSGTATITILDGRDNSTAVPVSVP